MQYFFLVYLVCDVLFLLLKYKGWNDEEEDTFGVRQKEKKGEIKETRITFFNAANDDIVLACFFLATKVAGSKDHFFSAASSLRPLCLISAAMMS